jgi:hypothetical protein
MPHGDVPPPIERFIQNLDEMGEDEARRGLIVGRFGANERFARAWLDQLERRRASEAQLEAEKRVESALKLTERATVAAEKSAIASEKSARWTFWAAVGACVAAAGSFVQAYLTK